MAYQRIAKVADYTLTVTSYCLFGSYFLRLGDQFINKKRKVHIQLTPEKNQVLVIPNIFFGAKVVTFSDKDYGKVEWHWRRTDFCIEKDGKTVVMST